MTDNSLTPPPSEETAAPEFLHSDAVLRSIPLVPLLAAAQLFAIFFIFLLVFAQP